MAPLVNSELAPLAHAAGSLPPSGETRNMAQGPLGKALRRTLLRLTGGRASPDGQLLERFVTRHDEEAFAMLVQRHGPMVYRVCQRVLRHAQDAEDAFQATFIVLARKAASLAQPELLANWLYGVATRVAREARSVAGRRGAGELLTDIPEKGLEAGGDLGADPDWRLALDEELSRLGDKYRAPLVLCYLEGKTNTEAAAALGCPVRTIEWRLARGRDLLRDRLQRRGLTLTAAALAGLLAKEVQASVVPAALLASAGRLPLGANPAAAATPAALDLADAALKATGTSRWKLAAITALAAALTLGVAGLLSRPQGLPANQTAQRVNPAPSWRLDRSIPVA